MSVPTHAVLPQWIQFAIGRSHDHDVLTRTIGVVKRDSRPVPRTVMGMVENYGEAAFTIEIDESLDNNLAGSGDAFADRAIRVDGAAVANGTLTVQPGGKAIFVIESTAASDPYWRFQLAAATPSGFGRLTLCSFDGALERRQRDQVP